MRLMTNSGDPSIWTYSVDLSSLSIAGDGDHFIAVSGGDLAGNSYSSVSEFKTETKHL